MKKCGTCKLEKSISDFNRHAGKPDGLQTRCRACQKVWYKRYYQLGVKEKIRLSEQRQKLMQEKRDYIRFKKSVPCMDCEVSYPYYVMDFDHRDPDEKEFTIATNLSRVSLSQLKIEIDKCDIVCANCHRVRTWRHLS